MDQEELITEIEKTETSQTSILWHSNAPWVPTGYGQQTAIFGPRIQNLGYRVAFSAFHGLRGSRIGWVSADGQPMLVYPGGTNAYGNDVLGAHARHWFRGKRGMVILLTDPWVLDARLGEKLPLVAWIPVDHDPLIPKTDDWLKRSGAIPVAMSRFGEQVMREAGHRGVKYVPHGVDPLVFKPVDRMAARRSLGIAEDAFVVGMVAANVGIPSRKCFGQAFKAFAKFQQHAPEALLYLHTRIEDTRGEHLPSLLRALEIRVHVADQYGLTLGTPASVVAATHNAFDVLLNPSMGEGFGIPLLEAQACGTPVISTNFSSMPEVAPADAGNWCVGGERWWTPFDSWQVTPAVEQLTDALVEAYEEAEDQRLVRRRRVLERSVEYHADTVATRYWKPALEEAELAIAFEQETLFVP